MTTPDKSRKRSITSEWVSDVEESNDSERGSSTSRRTPTTPVRRVKRTVRTPIRSPRPTTVKPTTPRPVTPRQKPEKPPPRVTKQSSPVTSGLNLASRVLISIIHLVHALLSPVYHYIFLLSIALFALSTISYLLWTYIPPLLFQAPGWMIKRLLPSTASLPDIAIGQSLALYPLRSFATPACALTGQLCGLSLLSSQPINGTAQNVVAKPFWKWTKTRQPEINMGEVARSLAKEVKGAKDIFESLELLSNGEMWNRLEHLRIWELATAIQVGSRLDEREVVASGLRELGHTVEDLSYEMVETNALAGVSFQWLVWEDLSAPASTRLPPQILSKKLNTVLTRLSANMDKLHELASRAYNVAQKGSIQGQLLHSNLNHIVADLKEAQDSSPGWKLVADKANRFFVGGELSKVERIAKDLVIADTAFTSLKVSVRDLERTRLGIKEFKDQIGYFDTNLMGFHLGAGEHVGIGVEDEIRVLAQVVEDFGSSIGRVKAQRGEVREISQ